MTAKYAFWVACESEGHARELCASRGLEFRFIRKVPQLKRKGHMQKEIFHARVHRLMDEDGARKLHAEFGFAGHEPEKVMMEQG